VGDKEDFSGVGSIFNWSQGINSTCIGKTHYRDCLALIIEGNEC
jgi:hypothetical protein